MNITTQKSANTVDGISYHFTRNNIGYTIFKKADRIEVWKVNNQRKSVSNDCFWNGVNNQGKPMAKFLQKFIAFTES